MSYPNRKEALTHRIDRPQCLENPRPQGGIFPLRQFSALLFTLSQNIGGSLRYILVALREAPDMRNLKHLRSIGLITLLGTLSWAQPNFPDSRNRLSGEIIFKDGSKVPFNYFFSSAAGDKLPYGAALADLKSALHEAVDQPMIRMQNVARIDFLPLTNKEKEDIRERKLVAVRKVNVTFNDRSTKQNLFVSFLDQAKWRNANEEGSLISEPIVSMTVRYKYSWTDCGSLFKKL